MLFLAVKNLVQEKTRLLISVGGVAFSVLLIMSIQGLYQGWSNKIGEYIRTVPADYWITQTGATDMFHTPSVLPLTARDRLAAVEGVASAKPFSGRRVAFEQPGRPWNNSNSDTGCGTCPGTSPAGRNSGWPSPAPSPTTLG